MLGGKYVINPVFQVRKLKHRQVESLMFTQLKAAQLVCGRGRCGAPAVKLRTLF